MGQENNNTNNDNVDIRTVNNSGYQVQTNINSKATADTNCETPQGGAQPVQWPEATKVKAQIIAITPSIQAPNPTPTPQSAKLDTGIGSSGSSGGSSGSFQNPPPKVTPSATVTLTGGNTLIDLTGSTLKRGDNEDNKALPSRVFGPYPQTLFLGCSVVGINVSLGWGNQPSQLSVTLAEDTSPHYICTKDGGRYKAAAGGAYSTPNHYYDVLKAKSDNNGNMESATTYYARVKDFVDINGNLIVPGKIYYAYNESEGKYEQRYWWGPDPGFLGAKNKFKDGSTQWKYTDPITGKFEESGVPIDILGCPVFFKLDDFAFCGIVKNWRASNSGTGGIQYVVDIEGPNELVNQTQLILDNYAGTVFTKAFGSSNSLAKDPSSSSSSDRKAISGPYNDPRDPQIPLTSYKGNIGVDGNIPNVINVYGFLEAAAPGSFGGANVNDSGIKTNLVYQALNFLLSFPNDKVDSYLPGETSRNMFNPYGALVGRTPMSSSPIDTSQLANYRIFTLSNSPTAQDQDYINPPPNTGAGVSFSSSTQSMNDGGASSGSNTLKYPDIKPAYKNTNGSESKPTKGSLLGPRAGASRIKSGVVGDIFDDKPTKGDGWVDKTGFSDKGSTVKIFSFGLIPPDVLPFEHPIQSVQVDEVKAKQLYYLDLSELPILSNQLRTDVSSGIKDLNSFIYDVCSNAGVDFFYELLYLKVQQGLPPQKFIKIRTVSRKVQPSDRAVGDYISKLRSWNIPVSSVSLGKEFNSQAKPRTMLIGAKQRRLFQTKNWSISYRSSSLIYSLPLQRFIKFDEATYPHVKNHNYFRIPNPGSVREPPAQSNPRLRSTRINELKVSDPEFYDVDTKWDEAAVGGTAIFPHRGNYFQSGDNAAAVRTGLEGGPSLTAISRESSGGGSDTSYTSGGGKNLSNTYIENIFQAIFSWAINGFKSKRTRSMDAQPHSVDNVNVSYTSSSSNSTSLISPDPGSSLETLGKIIADQGKALIDGVGSEYMKNKFVKSILNQFDPVELNTQESKDRFYPIMYNSVCPFFGTIDYIYASSNYNLVDKIKKPRPVWFDMWTNQLLVIFNVKELPINKLELLGIYNNGNFVVTESELRAAAAGYETWLDYLKGKIYKPDIFFMIKNSLCGDLDIPKPTSTPSPKPKPTPDKRKGPNDLGEDANVAQGPADQGGVLPKLPNIQLPPLTSDNDWDACRIFAEMFNIKSAWNQATNATAIGASATARPLGLHSSITYDLKAIHRFFANIAETYYGKQFMVRIPMVLSFKDREILENFDPRPTPTPLPQALAPNTLPEGNPPFGRPANTGGGSTSTGGNVSWTTNQINLSEDTNKPQYITEGSGKIYSNYNICPEGAWEEYGNCIDDAIMIGSYQASVFQDDKGLIQPILGYVADDRFDHEAYMICQNIKACAAQFVDNGVVFQYYDLLKRANMYQGHSRYSQYQKDGGGENGR